MNAVKTNRIHFLFLTAIAVILALPMLLYGPLAQGHDTLEHINYARHFSDQFWSGELYPRWLIGMNHGLGSASFFVFPPLPFYVYAIVEPVAKLLRLNAMSLTAFLALWGSGLSAFVWLRVKFEQNVALACAALYMLMPYHFWGDFYRRFALPECWAFVWMPLILYFTARVVDQKRRAMVGLAITYGLLILSHGISAAMFSFVPLAAAVAFSARSRRTRSAMRVAASMLLGIGLSSVYLFAALFHQRYFVITPRMFELPEFHWPDYLVTFGKGLVGHSSITRFTRDVSWVVLDMVFLITICAYAVFRKRDPDSRRDLVFWSLACAFAVFMMSDLSFPLWQTFPQIPRSIQYPWRFNTVLCVAALPILAVFLSRVPLRPLRSHAALLATTSALVGLWFVAWGIIWQRYWTQTVPPRNEHALVNDDDGWFHVWSPTGIDEPSALHATTEARVRFSGTTGHVDVLTWKPRHIEFRTNSVRGGAITINQFYYPAWHAEVTGQAGPAAIEAAIPTGLLQLRVPSGIQDVRFEIPVSTAERLGRWVSALCALFCLMLLIVRRGDAVPVPGQKALWHGGTDGC
jgi:hypothetical protein